MGDGGARNYETFERRQAWVYHPESGEKYAAEKVKFWKKNATEHLKRNIIGDKVMLRELLMKNNWA